MPRPLRYRLDVLVRNLKMSIAAGPNAGLTWSRVAAGKGFGAGTFEADRVEIIASLIRPGDCFWDIGAHKGYVTLIAARRVGAQSGAVYAFEPSSVNHWYLRQHVAWNHCSNVTIFPVAVSHFDGESSFGGGGSLGAHLGGGREQSVPVRSIASLITSGECRPPTFLKIDAEGAEADILEGAQDHLRRPDILLVVGTHTPALHARCLALLKNLGLHLVESGSAATAPQSWKGIEPQILAFGPDRVVPDAALAAFERL